MDKAITAILWAALMISIVLLIFMVVRIVKANRIISKQKFDILNLTRDVEALSRYRKGAEVALEQEQERSRKLENNNRKLSDDISEKDKELKSLRIIKRKYKFIQSNAPKYSIGEKVKGFKIVQLDVKLSSLITNIARGVISFFSFGLVPYVADKSSFLYVVKDLSKKDAEDTEEFVHTVDESFFDAKKPVLPKNTTSKQ